MCYSDALSLTLFLKLYFLHHLGVVFPSEKFSAASATLRLQSQSKLRKIASPELV